MSQNFGGFPSLTLQSSQDFLYSLKNSYESARAGVVAVLKQVAPHRVWLPWYICDDLSQIIENHGFRLIRYNLDEDFSPKIPHDMGDHDVLIYPNYFGLSDHIVEMVLKNFSPSKVIIDNASALFSKPRDCLATVYSPRKFIGIPDGGIVVTDLALESPKVVNPEFLKLCAYVYLKQAHIDDLAYSMYRQAENAISINRLYKMSGFSEYYLRTCEEKYTIPKRRRDNYDLLDSHFKKVNRLEFKRACSSVPLCYPLHTEKKRNKKQLIEKGVFVPSYWPDVNRDNLNEFELEIYEKCLFLPCDQRMTNGDVEDMSKTVKEVLGYE